MMVISNILSIFAEIFDESLESEGGMGANIERDKLKTRKGYQHTLSVGSNSDLSSEQRYE